MKILVFDIGGTAIKYGICKNGHLEETKEYPTEAFRGGTHILNTICRLSEQYLPFDAIGISTAGQVNPDEGSIIYANSNITFWIQPWCFFHRTVCTCWWWNLYKGS